MRECSPSLPRAAILILLCVAIISASGCWRKKHHYVYTPAPVTTPISTAVVAGFRSCNLQPTGKVKCWGYNADGQLGQGDQVNRGDAPNQMGANLTPVDLGSGRTVVQLVSGTSHNCVLLDNGVTKCWGANWVGQLGQGDTINRGDAPNQMGDNLPTVDLGTGRTAITLVTGSHHTCAILDNGSVKCWGYNPYGQLGQGDAVYRGYAPNQMGDNLPTVDFGSGRTVVALVAGEFHTCALLDNGVTKCWGGNDYGQLGQGDTTARGDLPNQMGDNLPAVDFGAGRTAIHLTAGVLHTCAILDNGSVKCWGYNVNGQLGLGDTANRGEALNQMGDNLPAIDFGTGRTASTMTGGSYHNCAILDNSSVKCWGANWYGQLGLGDSSHRGDSGGQMGDNLPAIELGSGRTALGVALGDSHTCAMLDNGATKCWGRNFAGQLGLGDANSRGDVPNQMGDNLPAVDL